MGVHYHKKPTTADGKVFSIDAFNKLCDANAIPSGDYTDSRIDLQWDFSKITGLNDEDDIITVPDISGNGYDGFNSRTSKFQYETNETPSLLPTGHDFNGDAEIRTNAYAPNGSTNGCVSWVMFGYSNNTIFGCPTAGGQNGLRFIFQGSTTFRIIASFNGVVGQQIYDVPIPDQAGQNGSIYSVVYNIDGTAGGNNFSIFIDGVNVASGFFNASATSILADGGETNLGNLGSIATSGTGLVDYGELIVMTDTSPISTIDVQNIHDSLSTKWLTGGSGIISLVDRQEQGMFMANSALSNNSYVFDGVGDWIEFNGTGVVSSPLSIEVWMKFDVQNPSTSDYDYIVLLGNDGAGAGANFSIGRFAGSGNNGKLYVTNGSSSIISADVFLNDAGWIHVVLTLNESNEMTVFKNGVEGTIGDYGTTQNGFSGKIRFGQSNSVSFRHWFDGKLGLCNIYNRILTPEEVLENYESQKSKYL